MGYYKENAWWTSPYNARNTDMPSAVPILHDATLRDGEQTPGVVFSEEEKVVVAEKLVAAGVTRIEAGMPAVSDADFRAITEIARKLPQAEIYAFTRAAKADINMARDCGVRGVVIEVPIGYPKLKYQFKWTWEKAFEKSAESILYAQQNGLRAVLFPYDATRADEEDLEQYLSHIAAEAPPESIGVVDTMGCALPSTIQYMVRWYKRILPGADIEVHCHNDFGQAVACELAGMAAGANVLHACVNGLGERTGNASLEELALNLNILMEMDTPYDLQKMTELCETVEQFSGVPIASNKPFGGRQNYTRESGIGIDMVMEQPLAMFATDPRYFGRTASVVLGKKSGKASVQFFLEKMHRTASDEQVAEILQQVKHLGIRKKALVTEQEFSEILDKIL